MQSCKNCAITLPGMVSGYAGHATIFSRTFSSGVRVSNRVMIRFSVWMVSSYVHLFLLLKLLSVDIVWYPKQRIPIWVHARPVHYNNGM